MAGTQISPDIERHAPETHHHVSDLKRLVFETRYFVAASFGGETDTFAQGSGQAGLDQARASYAGWTGDPAVAGAARGVRILKQVVAFDGGRAIAGSVVELGAP